MLNFLLIRRGINTTPGTSVFLHQYYWNHVTQQTSLANIYHFSKFTKKCLISNSTDWYKKIQAENFFSNLIFTLRKIQPSNKILNIQALYVSWARQGSNLASLDYGTMMVQKKALQASIIIQHSQGLLYIIRRKIQWWWIKWNLPRESVANLFSHMSLQIY